MTPAGAPKRVSVSSWEGATAEELATAWRVPAVLLYETVDSTNDVAREWAENGAADGSVVIAEAQSSGRGRVGRGWSSAPGLGLWMSVIHQPVVESDTLPLRVAVAVADALDAQLPRPQVMIKWPNDLLIEGKKTGGILCEAAWAGQELISVVVGIGLNLLHSEHDFPEEVRDAATSLRLTAGESVSRFAVAGAILAGLQRAARSSLQGQLHEQLTERDFLQGKSIDVLEPESGRRLVSGRARGISEEGALLVQSAGEVREVRSGTIRLT